MKTNNRLSKDNNTHEPKVRPMVKVVQHEVWVQFDYEKGKMELHWFEDTNYYYKKDRATGNTREVERPMNDTEYFEYLEEQVIDTFAKLVSVEELSKQTISTLEKENQELKGRLKLYE